MLGVKRFFEVNDGSFYFVSLISNLMTEEGEREAETKTERAPPVLVQSINCTNGW